MSSIALRRLPWQVVVGANGRQLSSAAVAARESKALKEDSAVQNSVEGGSFAMADEASGVLARVAELVQRERLVSDKYDKTKKVVDFLHPDELRAALPLSIGRQGCSDEELQEISEAVVKYSVKTCHPHFYNQLYHGADEYGVAGSWLSDALNTNIHTFEVAPSFIIIEHSVLGHIRKLFDWGEQGDGIFSPGGSLSNMYGMMLARHNAFPDIKRTGLSGAPTLVALTSEESHYSIVKGANWLGMGVDNVVKVLTDSGGRMIPEELDKALDNVKAGGRVPFFVNATSGSTVLGAYDDLEALAEVCSKHKVWLHVDACWGGSAILSRKYKHLMKGSDKVDSIAWNPHKMVGAPLQTSPFIVRHKGLLHQCNSASATYLFQQDKFYDVSYDTGDKSVQCGRKVDAFKLWFMLKARGEDYMEDIVDNTFAMTDYLEELVRNHPGFRLVPEYSTRQCTNLGFWYIPERLRGKTEDEAWWKEIGSIAPKVKEQMILEGTLMIGYQPLPYKGLANFFRMVLHAVPKPSKEDMEHIVNEIHTIGSKL